MRHPKKRLRRRPVVARASCGIEKACGGCPLLPMPFREQITTKTNAARSALAAYPALAGADVEACVPAPRGYGYRVRAKLAVRRQRDGVRVGLFRRGSDHLIDLAPCLVHRPAIQEALPPLKAWLNRERLAYPEGPVIVVDLRESAGETLHLTLVVDGASPQPEVWPLDKLRAGLARIAGVALNEGDARSSYAMGPASVALVGSTGIELELPLPGGALVLEVPPGAFFQVNPAALPKVHERMATHLVPCAELVDLYCGVGTHALCLAERVGARRVLGIEEHAEAARAAARNAARAGVEGHFVAGRVEELLASMPLPAGAFGVVLNPGRPGCRAEVLDAILAARPGRVAYLSCNPETLARDLARLVAGGLGLDRVVPFDFMPQTDQVEALALLA